MCLLFASADALALNRDEVELLITSDGKRVLSGEFNSESPIPFTLRYRGRSLVGKIRPRGIPLTNNSSLTPKGLTLLKGHSRLGGLRDSIGASVYNGGLTINFKDRGGVFTAEFAAFNHGSSGVVKGSLSRTPRFIKVDDGHIASPTHYTQSLPASLGAYGQSPGTSLSSDYMLELRVVIDGALISVKGSKENALVHVLSAINTAEVIYTTQLNTIIRVVDIQTVASSKLASIDPYDNGGCSSFDPYCLLDQFTEYENSNQSSGHDLSHLFTGRELNGSTVGLAFLGVVCDYPTAKYGLTQVKNFQSFTSLIFAHEIGHNFGADHDSATPSLMSPYIDSDNNSFSAFSLNEINTYLGSSGACVQSDISNPDPLLANFYIRSVEILNSGRFLLKAVPFSNVYNECDVSLFGATDKAYLEEESISVSAIPLQTFNSSQGRVKLRVAAMPKDVSGSRRLYFRLKVECTGITSFSDIETLTLGAAGALNKSAWLNALDSKNMSVIPY
jgi:hypothetical protein